MPNHLTLANRISRLLVSTPSWVPLADDGISFSLSGKATHCKPERFIPTIKKTEKEREEDLMEENCREQ